jgi:hypothetical protein
MPDKGEDKVNSQLVVQRTPVGFINHDHYPAVERRERKLAMSSAWSSNAARIRKLWVLVRRRFPGSAEVHRGLRVEHLVFFDTRPSPISGRAVVMKC